MFSLPSIYIFYLYLVLNSKPIQIMRYINPFKQTTAIPMIILIVIAALAAVISVAINNIEAAGAAVIFFVVITILFVMTGIQFTGRK